MKIGFAITAYNKFEEAKISFEIIRKEFKNNYKISFCSNHPDGRNFAISEKIDYYVQGRDIPYYGGDIHRPESLANRISIVLRSTDTVIQSCKNALKMDVDYIVHIHSDAWVLNEEKLIKIVDDLRRSNKKIALRGAGLETFYADTPLGHMDDHFFIFEKKYFEENKIFDFRPEHFFPHLFTVHGILFINILTKVGLDKIWYYTDTKKLLNYDNEVLGMRTVKPVSYDSQYNFLHIHRESFPEKYGESIQAMYLKKEDFKNSEYIKEFIDKYYKEPNTLLKELKNIESNINKKLKLYFYSNDVINNREIVYKQKLVSNLKLSIAFKNIFYRLIKYFYSKLRKTKNIYDITEFYRNDIQLSNFVEDDWTKNLYTLFNEDGNKL